MMANVGDAARSGTNATTDEYEMMSVGHQQHQ